MKTKRNNGHSERHKERERERERDRERERERLEIYKGIVQMKEEGDMDKVK
jgi:hypothetical protein